MTDYEQVHNRNPKNVLRTFRNVARIEPIPNGCNRVHFERGFTKTSPYINDGGNCKIKLNYLLRRVKLKEEREDN